MSMHSDDELDSPTLHRPTTSSTAPKSFNFDDAFSDTDDDPPYEFSPAAIRQELEKSLSSHLSADNHWPVDHELSSVIGKIGFADDPDASVSTFDINAGYDQQLSPPTQQPPSPDSRTNSHPSVSGSLDEIGLSNEFSTVSLESPHPDREVDQEDFEQHAQAEPHTPEYLTMQTGISEERLGPAVARVATPPPPEPERSTSPPTPPHYEADFAEAGVPLPITPQSTASFSSTVSLPMTASTSTPTSAQSSAATSSSFAAKHKASRSAGPSMLDKVVSKTRPSFLPPKNRKEDIKHMADWETMMKHSRAAEEKRRKALQERRFARERRIEESLVHWEREIVPDWRVVYKQPKLRKLWWQGIPSKLRATMWQNAVGNPLALSKDAYRACNARATRALSAGTFPAPVLALIEEDIAGTLPSLHLFIPEKGPLYQDLKDMLCAWVVSRSDERLGYVPGVAKIAAMILLNMAPAPGFILMRNVLERHCLRSFYGGDTTTDEVEAYYRIFDTLLADGMPKIYFNFKQHQISPAAYLPEWLIPLFLEHLPFEACARLWDILCLEGDSFLFRASLAILAVLEPRLFFPDRQELLELLKGENKAALEAAKRNGRVLGGARYEIYDLDEETLWERLDAMEDWWRESTWTRLIQRELPDL